MSGDRQRLYESVARAIIDAIHSGEFRPGGRLPGERELAERFQVSRVTIREAEIALEAQGYVSVRTGSGVYVAKAQPSRGGGGPLPDVSAFDLTTARSVVEAEAAALAAGNVTNAQLGELERLIEAMVAADAEESGQGEDIDRLFHLQIAEATGNAAILHLVHQLWRMRSELPQVRAVYGQVCAAHAATRAAEHRTILEALKRRDAHGARMAMREHFHRLFEAMLTAREAAAIAELKRTLGEDRQRFMQATLLPS